MRFFRPVHDKLSQVYRPMGGDEERENPKRDQNSRHENFNLNIQV